MLLLKIVLKFSLFCTVLCVEEITDLDERDLLLVVVSLFWLIRIFPPFLTSTSAENVTDLDERQDFLIGLRARNVFVDSGLICCISGGAQV